MKVSKITRKKFLANAGMFSLSAVVGGTWLSSCASPSGQPEQESATDIPAQDPESNTSDAAPMGSETEACNDLSGLSEQEVSQREQLQYVAQSPKEEQICANCQFWQPSEDEATACGGCQLIKGPIHPNGWCQTWSPKQT